MAEETFGYGSAPGTPTSLGSEKKKRGLKKLLSNFAKKKNPTLDKSFTISEEVRFESMLDEDGGGGLQNRHKGSSIFKRRVKNEDGSLPQAIHPTKEFPSEGFMKETKKEETKPENNEKKNGFEEKTELLEKERNEASKEESKPSKLDPPAVDTNKPELVKKAEEEMPSVTHNDRNDDPMMEYSKLEKSDPSQVANGEGLKLLERAKEDDQHHHDHKQTQETTEINGEPGDQELEIAIGATKKKSQSPASPPPPPPSPPSPPRMQEKEVLGCESVAKGLQKMCLPWTVNKED